MTDYIISTEEPPLTTEEPLNNPELLQEIKDLNAVDDPHDIQVPTAIIIDKEEPNKLHSHPLPIPSQLASTVTTTTTIQGALETPKTLTQLSNNESEDDDDDELKRITESNRHITPPPPTPQRPRSKSLRSLSLSVRRQLLVFSDQPTVIEQGDRIITHYKYGAGPKGALDDDQRPTRQQRSYLVACDFSDESQNAIEWTTGTMMRDGDRLYVVTVVNREDNPEAVKKTGLSLSKELKKASESVTEISKKALKQMLLFDIDLITFAICGRVKTVLSKLIEDLSLTMVICGSRGRGTMTGYRINSYYYKNRVHY
ncbi:uncharacterized protein BX663DRAFT_524392 [Cokeromyces recurvatus]|uniref:uncharacterized protein n=1 Tax=Cokeromyces recurvatus TaxID=90255 RepID=UPI00221E4F58|nr:uncharacterized protein BX663DRAFT_524392 [Cokeromyces recurvatus]KAI7898521.1 hypothetical protein BX663DRAFT_524392 [Cokeromyces recurvatus]